MSRRAREIETLLLTMLAAAPLYLTRAAGIVPLIVFHVLMAAIVVRVATGRGPEILPPLVMKVIAIAYVPIYILDAAVLSHSAIAASTHLVLFIALYQPIESLRSNNQRQRMLTTALIFVASLATSTHISITLFVLLFGFLMFRQMMYVSHLDTVGSIDRRYIEAPSGSAAVFYLLGAAAIGVVLFPFLPRVRNPLIQGISGALTGATTGLSETINLNEQRSSSNDATVVARVWMSQQTIPFFTPLRLRGTVYDRFYRGEWRQSRIGGLRHVPSRDGRHHLAKPSGITRSAVVQMRPMRGRLFFPTGTYVVTGLPTVYEGPHRENYSIFQQRSEVVTFDVRMAFNVAPIEEQLVSIPAYPLTPAVVALARQIVGNELSPSRKAARIEAYMLRNFRYVANPADLRAEGMGVEQFLLETRAGHCEYFAAGMVVLLGAVDVPARIAGGFYGGRLNPLTGYFTIRREDAHAWVEAWDGTKWLTYDATPPSLRPGSAAAGLFGVYASAITDSINYFWDRYVLTFGLGDQITLMADLITAAKSATLAARRNVAAG
ncbi:MAG: DUF3488 and transglutaminase-like domain-containing protein, partial [Thermoanaerobaculia bacterium]